MLSIEVRVNRDLIGHAYIKNTQTERRNKIVYEVTYYKPSKEEIMKFEVLHKPDEGVEKLIFLVYGEVVKRLDEA